MMGKFLCKKHFIVLLDLGNLHFRVSYNGGAFTRPTVEEPALGASTVEEPAPGAPTVEESSPGAPTVEEPASGVFSFKNLVLLY